MRYSTPPAPRRHRKTPENRDADDDGENDDAKSTATPIAEAFDSVRRMTLTLIHDVNFDVICDRAMTSLNKSLHCPHDRQASAAWVVSQERRLDAVKNHYFRPLENVVVARDTFEHCDAKKFFKFYFENKQVEKFHLERGDQDVIIQRWKTWRGGQRHLRDGENKTSSRASSPSLITEKMPLHIFWGGAVLERTITFRTPVKVPMGPKHSAVNIQQRLLRIADDMYVVESYMQLLDVPFSNRFHVVTRQTIESNRPSQVRRGSLMEMMKTKTNGKERRSVYGSRDDMEGRKLLSLFARDDVQQLQLREENRPPDLQAIGSEETEETEESVFRLVPPAPSMTALRVEFEIRFTKSCKFEDRIRHTLTKKISRLLSSWCHETHEEWIERMDASPPPTPASPTSVRTQISQRDAPSLSTDCAGPTVPTPTAPRKSVDLDDENDSNTQISQRDALSLSTGSAVPTVRNPTAPREPVDLDDENDLKDDSSYGDQVTRTSSTQTRWQPLHRNKSHQHISLMWSMTDLDVDDLEDLYDTDDESTITSRQEQKEDEGSYCDETTPSGKFMLMEWRSELLSEISGQNIFYWDDLERDGGEFGVEIYDIGGDFEDDEDADLESSHFVWNTSSQGNNVLTYERLLELVRAGMSSSNCFGHQCNVEVVYVTEDENEIFEDSIDNEQEEPVYVTEDENEMSEDSNDEREEQKKTEMDEVRSTASTYTTNNATQNKNYEKKERIRLKRYIMRLLKVGKIRKVNSNRLDSHPVKKPSHGLRKVNAVEGTKVPDTAVEI